MYEFEILESICPYCMQNGVEDSKTNIIAIGGTDKFLQYWTIPKDVEKNVWHFEQSNPDDFLDEGDFDEEYLHWHDNTKPIDGVGSLTFECLNCHKEIYIEKLSSGDWSSGF